MFPSVPLPPSSVFLTYIDAHALPLSAPHPPNLSSFIPFLIVCRLSITSFPLISTSPLVSCLLISPPASLLSFLCISPCLSLTLPLPLSFQSFHMLLFAVFTLSTLLFSQSYWWIDWSWGQDSDLGSGLECQTVPPLWILNVFVCVCLCYLHCGVLCLWDFEKALILQIALKLKAFLFFPVFLNYHGLPSRATANYARVPLPLCVCVCDEHSRIIIFPRMYLKTFPKTHTNTQRHM